MPTAQNVKRSPKYLYIKETLAQQIRSGELAPNAKLVPERELARHFSVSYATVTRALGELQVAGLIIRQWGKGTFVAEVPRSLVNVAVTFKEPIYSDNYLLPLVQGIQTKSAVKGWRIQMFPLQNAEMFSGGQHNLLSFLLREGHVGGVIALDPSPPEDFARLRTMGVPAVSVLNRYSGSGASSIMDDPQQGAIELVQRLSQLGHSRIRFLMGPTFGHSARLLRSSGWMIETLFSALREAGLPCQRDAVFHAPDFSWSMCEQTVRRWLCERPRPTAIVCATDVLAMHVTYLASEFGIAVPEELSVIGWGDALTPSKLTSVHVPFRAIGEASARLLEQLVTCGTAVDEVLPTKLVVRETMGPARD